MGVSGAWAESKLSKAVAGTYVFDSSSPALTVKKEGASIWTNNDGSIAMSHADLSTVTSSRTYAAVVMRVEMPTTIPSSFKKFINLKTASNNTGSIGLGVTTEGKLKGTWEAEEWSPSGGGVVTSSAVTGEHTIVMLCNDDGTTIYVDDAKTKVNKQGLRCGTKWTNLRIESDYVSCVKSIYVFSGEQKDNIATFFSELSNVVTVANGETKSVSDNSTATRFFVASGGTLTADEDYDADKIEVVGNVEIVSEKTLTVNVAWFDLTKITGGGDVTLDADVTISGSKSTVATGKLTINEGKTLTLGTGQDQANSIESFTSIELAGTIKHNNSKATFNGVTVPTGKTGKIFAYDMGTDADGFKLAGTTTLNGDLTVCNRYNFQMKVDALAGSGTLLICGTTGDSFNAEGTASQEKAIINVAAATTFTGTINLNNVPTDSTGTNTSQVTVQGNLVGCTLKKTTGDYFYYSGANLNGTTLDGVILSGSSRITTSNTVNIKNLAGNNLNNTDHLYAFVGSGTINFYGTNDLTKKSDGSVCNSANIGYVSSANVIIKAGANVTAGVVLNSVTLSSNAPITVEETATLTCVGSTHADNATLLIYSTNLTNNGTINLNADGRTSQVSALSGSGTLNVASGSTIKAPSTISNTMTLTGAGDVVLTSFPSTTAPTLSAWTGAVEFPNGSGGDLQAIFNAWGNTNSTIKLNNVTGGYLGNNGTVDPTLNILSGKTLILNNGYSNSDATLTKVTGAGTLDRQSWSGSTNHNLIITTLTDFSGTLKGTGHPIDVKKLVVASAPYANGLLIKTSGDVTLEQLYVGLEETTAYTWETKTVEEVEGIYVASFDQVQLCREMAANAVAPYFNHIGTGVGKYTITLGLNNYTSTADFTEAVEAWTTTADYVNPTVTINQPTSAFYRIKSGSKYLQDVRKSDDATQRTLTDASGANESAGTIFYLNNNTFVGYKTGYGFGFSVCQTQDTEHLNSMLFTESAEMGKYTIQSQQGTYASASYNEGYWGVDGSDLSREDDAASGACWTIEEVDALPVNISAAGYATLYAPVALTIPSGVTAYRVSVVSTTEATLAPIATTIPANTPVILSSGTAGSKNFAIDATNTDVAPVNKLEGSVVAKAWTDEYTLQLNDTNNEVGLYGNSPTNGVIPGFKAYMPKSAVGANNVKGFAFAFDTETLVKAIEAAQNPGKVVYDLNGRRVLNPKKGLYIVNGKKVVIK